MSREQKYNAIILKKQAFGEGDEIITFYTKEQGKVRFLAKSVKKNLSKLQQKLQTLFLVEVVVASGSKLPKIIGVEPMKVFSKLREDLDSLKVAFLGMELMLKFTPDEQKNEKLYQLFLDFLDFLEENREPDILSLGLAKFKIGILQVSGFGVDYFSELILADKIYFTPARGGFSEVSSVDSYLVSVQTYQLFLNIIKAEFSTVSAISTQSKLSELQNLLSQFIEYQLERTLKSEKYLDS